MSVTSSQSRPSSEVRTLFISDVHLGTPDCQADLLSSFLKRYQFEQLYLVGDVFDLLAMRKRSVLPRAQQALVMQVIRLARRGVRVTFIPGNHDALLRRFCGFQLQGLNIERRSIHQTADGRRLLITHGDEFDGDVQVPNWLHLLGDRLHAGLLKANRGCNGIRRFMGLPYWSLAGAVKRRLSGAQRYIDRYRQAALREVGKQQEASQQALAGIVTGHIHQADMVKAEAGLYLNTGDWVEHCTALIEDTQGRLSLVNHQGECLCTEPHTPPIPIQDKLLPATYSVSGKNGGWLHH